MNVPDGLRYSKDHEWVRVEGDVATVGITDYAKTRSATSCTSTLRWSARSTPAIPSVRWSRPSRCRAVCACQRNRRLGQRRTRNRAREAQHRPVRRGLDLHRHDVRCGRTRRPDGRRGLPGLHRRLIMPGIICPSCGLETRSDPTSARRAVPICATTTSPPRRRRSRSTTTSMPSTGRRSARTRGCSWSPRGRSPALAMPSTATRSPSGVIPSPTSSSTTSPSRDATPRCGATVRYRVRDVGSLNGTYINRDRVDRTGTP